MRIKRYSRRATALFMAITMLLLLVPAIGVAPAASAAEQRVASVDFTNGTPTLPGNGITLADFGGDPSGPTGVVDLPTGVDPYQDGTTCGEDRDFLRVAVDSSIITSDDKSLLITVTYWDAYNTEKDANGNNFVSDSMQKFRMQYTTGLGTGDSQFTDGGIINLTNTNSWQTYSFATANASFIHDQDGKYDFRIGCIALGVKYTDGPNAGNWMNFPLYIAKVTVSTAPDVDGLTPGPVPPSTGLNNMYGKSITGYQMWFQSTNTSTGWVHWNGGTIPAAGRITVEQYPDVRDYPADVLNNTAFLPLGNGEPSQLFTSKLDGTVQTQVGWMQQYGIDGFAIQRFFGETSMIPQQGRTNLDMARDAAEKDGRIFYVMYDLNGAQGSGMGAVDRIKADWVYNVEGRQPDDTFNPDHTQDHCIMESPNYAQMDGKPVVSLWGLDSNSTSYATHDAALAIINWFKDRGVYVIGGIPNNDWGTKTTDFDDVYKALNMASPWNVGRFDCGAIGSTPNLLLPNGTANPSNNLNSWLTSHVDKQIQWCQTYGVDYQPTVFAGSAWSNFNWGDANGSPRKAGTFLWYQALQYKNRGVNNVYFSMFDEYDEGTAIMKTAEDSSEIPQGTQYFLTNSADGSWLSSDFYLRLAGAICTMMRGADVPAITTPVPVPQSMGPVYFRNSFEFRKMQLKTELATDSPPSNNVTISSSDKLVARGSTGKYSASVLNFVTDASVKWSIVTAHKADTTINAANGVLSVGVDEDQSNITIQATSSEDSAKYAQYIVRLYTWTYAPIDPSIKSCNKNYKYIYGQTLDQSSTSVIYDADGNILRSDNVDTNSSALHVMEDGDGDIARTGVYYAEYSGVATGSGNYCYYTMNDANITVAKDMSLTYYIKALNTSGQYVFLDLLFSDGTRLSQKVSGILGKKNDTDDWTKMQVWVPENMIGQTITGILVGYDKDPTANPQWDAIIDDVTIDTLSPYQQATVTPGDVNNDGKVDTTDARMVLQYVVKKLTAANINMDAADVNHDGKVDTTDARMILQYIVHKLDNL